MSDPSAVSSQTCSSVAFCVLIIMIFSRYLPSKPEAAHLDDEVRSL